MNREPLPERMRPKSLKEVIGQSKLLGQDGVLTKVVAAKIPTNIIFWGPPGVGKTTLARIIARELEADFVELSAVTSGKKDVQRVVELARQNWNLGLRTVLFVDEIHRFNKAQQDGFLPHVESGLITLIGATTENPGFEIINPLLSRVQVLVLEPLSTSDLEKLITRALKEFPSAKITPKARKILALSADGDARRMLNNLELLLGLKQRITPELIAISLGKKQIRYDKNGDNHYDNISAFIKSLRAGQTEAVLYYMARMLAAGEDPKFIARRMVVFASEDIGLAGNGALALAVATFEAVARVGLPEARYNLYHCAIALSESRKSRAVTEQMHQAEALAQKYPNATVPDHLKNAPTKLARDLGHGKDYRWESGFRHTSPYLPDEIVKSRK